jgi:tetratricopeptide (TPR) repeat protein
MTGGPDSGVHNVLDGHTGNAVQAGRIEGGVHFHGRREVKLPHMVPPPTPYFTNQTRVLETVDRAWADTAEETPHFVVFKGLGGLGKRAVARQWLRTHAEDFPDGQFHADLTGIPGADGLESTKLREFLTALGVADSDIPETAEGRAATFRSWTKDKKVAVCVDLALTPSQVRMLSPGPGRSVVLVTATEKLTGLGIRERVTQVDLGPFDDLAARQLLGRLVTQDRVEAEPEQVGKLIGFCDGLPIALCVVGALLKEFPERRIARLVRDLENQQRRLALLSPEEDLSVTAVFDTAYDHLGNVERRIYELLGVHPGTGTVHVETVKAALGLKDEQLGEAIDRLIVSGLVQETPDERLSVHSLVRLHALTKTSAASRDEALRRVLYYYHAVGVAAGHAAAPTRGWRDQLLPHLAKLDDNAPAKPMVWLTAERANLLAAALAAEETENPEYTWELAILLWPLHERGKYFDDLAALGDYAAKAAKRAGLPAVESLSTVQKGFAELQRGEPRAAVTSFEHALAVAEVSGVRDLVATAMESLGLALLAIEDRARAEQLLRRNLALAEEIGVARRIALAQLHLAKACEPAEAYELLSAAREWFARAEPVNVAKCDLWLGITCTGARNWSEALIRLSSALDAMGQEGRPFDEMLVLTALGDLAAAQGDITAAVDAYERALVIAGARYPAQEREIRAKIAALELPDPDRDLGVPGTVTH